MNNLYIANNEDLFNVEIPDYNAGVQTSPASYDESPMPEYNNNQFMSFTIMVFCILLIIIICLFLKKLAKNTNPMKGYTKQQTNKASSSQAYVSSINRLQTPENIQESIRLFLERTK